MAFDPSGRTTGAMATDAEDVDGDGRLDLLVTNFNQPGHVPAHERGRDAVRGPRRRSSASSMATFKHSSFGARFLDYDNDGDVDLFIAAGHPFAPVAKVWPEIHYADPPFLFENDGRALHERRARTGARRCGRRTWAGASRSATTTTTATRTSS